MEPEVIRSQGRETEDVTLVPFSPAHLDGAWALSRALAWPFRREDWDFALRLGRGFVLARGGAVIGTSAWFPYGETHATAGFVIVSGSEQGRGYGARLMDALLAAARPRSVILNATPEGRALYERRGFRAVGTIQQHQGIVGKLQDPPAEVVRDLGSADFETVARLDRTATGLDRRPLLQNLLAVGDGHVLLRDGAPVGYAVTRLFGRGHVVGPVVAESAAEARLLLEAALARLGGRFVRVDTAAIRDLGPWLEEVGLARVSDALTMVLGTLPPAGTSRVFALASQSLN